MSRFRALCFASRSGFSISVLIGIRLTLFRDLVFRRDRFRFPDPRGEAAGSYGVGVSGILAPCGWNRCQDENAKEPEPAARESHGSEISDKTCNGASTRPQMPVLCLRFVSPLDQFDLVAFWRVDECDFTGAR